MPEPDKVVQIEAGNSTADLAPRPNPLLPFWNLINHFLAGLAFGFALEKAKVYLPTVIVRQMRWSELTMLIAFLTATITGMFAIAILEYFGQYKRKPKPPLALFESSIIGKFGNNLIGGSLVGIGMALSGACPGTVLVQIGAGVPASLYVVIGTLIGAVTYGYLDNIIVKKLIPSFGSPQPVIVIDNKRVPFLAISVA
ncbi:hypothetical protein HDU79_008827, partial [Rhizoclosmatium sp. JEL0117]